MKAGTDNWDATEHLKGMAYHEAGHAVVAYLLVERTT
jgi:ATP-dependent Zn protease